MVLTILSVFFFVSCSNALVDLENPSELDAGKGRGFSWPILQNGNSSPQVKALQYLLINKGYSLAADGAFGPGTLSAVTAFQTSKGLTADGVVGNATWPLLIVTVQNGSSGNAVKAVQTLLVSRFGYVLNIDGAFGPGTLTAVKAFQSAKGLSADGIVGSGTWIALVGNTTTTDFWGVRAGNWVFPVKTTFYELTGSSRYFGANRDGGARAHAGVDIIPTTGPGATVYAMTSGIVLAYYYFYMGTYALEVKNSDGTVVRYGEISSNLRAGASVSKGQAIGTIIRNTSSAASYMLHLEMYMGTTAGALTNSSNTYYKYVTNRNYSRRSDLLDPMGVIKLR